VFPHREDIEKVLQAALSRGAEFAEVYLEKRIADTVRIEEQLVRESSRGVLAGAGIRAVIGDKIGYAYADGLDVASMVEAARVAGEIAALGTGAGPVSLSEAESAAPYSLTRIFPLDVSAEKKVETAFRASPRPWSRSSTRTSTS
jgi:TldD protein